MGRIKSLVFLEGGRSWIFLGKKGGKIFEKYNMPKNFKGYPYEPFKIL